VSAGELPSDVREALCEARQEVAARADGHLPMATRRALRRTLAQEPPSATEAAGPAAVLTRLDELCVLRALPAWIAERPGDERPQRALAIARELFERQTEFATVKLELDRFDVELDDLGLARTAERAWAVGQAAVDTAFTAQFGDYYGSDMPPGTNDEGLDPYGWAVDFLTCLAEAPSFPRDGILEHVEPRRAFWRWYLDEAVPEAWRATGGP